MSTHREIELRIRQGRVFGRRDFLRGVSLGAATSALGFPQWMAAHADELRKNDMACIVLWMQGGPSQLETFDPKPGHENGGATKAIDTNVAGIQISENFPHLAKVASELAIIRSMTSKEGNHQRATYQLHTGYAPTPTVKHPALGAVVAKELPNPACELPAFVRIGQFRNSGGGGLLGIDYDPFLLNRADAPPANTQLPTDSARFNGRLALLSKLEKTFADSGAKREVEDHQKVYEKTAKMVLSPQMKVFDLAGEKSSTRESYGSGDFASGCLMARRLVEAGVPFVEVGLGNWDTHQDNADRVKGLAMQCDQPFAALLRDLKDRGRLDKTLVVWMGEFGRTPKINPRNGRDHYPRAFNAVLAGGGVRGGQVWGKTDAAGVDVADNPVSVNDLFQTFCHAMRINAKKEYMSSIGRPIRIVDGGEPVLGLFS